MKSMPNDLTKYCAKCNNIKPLSHFHRNRARHDGVSVYCKECMKQKHDEWRKTPEGREKHNAQFIKWKAAHRDQFLELERKKGKERRSRSVPENKTLVCRHCGREGGLDLFPKSVLAKFLSTGDCRDCRRKRTLEIKQERKHLPREYRFVTFTGSLYKTQRRSSVERGHPPPDYTLTEFRDWIRDQDNFQQMVDRWVSSGFKRTLKPTVDRINPFEHYHLKNIQLITVSENNQKARFDAQVVYLFMARLYKESGEEFRSQFQRHLDDLSKRKDSINKELKATR